jgi:hypothetical protein
MECHRAGDGLKPSPRRAYPCVLPQQVPPGVPTAGEQLLTSSTISASLCAALPAYSRGDVWPPIWITADAMSNWYRGAHWHAAAQRWRVQFVAVGVYILLAIVFSWPLPAHLQTHLPGPPGGDTGVYVWNLWVFQYEVLEHRTLPYFTDRIFRATGRTNLSLHNYTAFANLLALPFVQRFGIIATFNVVYLAMTVLTAYAMFLLARRLCGDDPWISWLAGAVFAWSPVLVTRGSGHYSLVAAAPLAVFVLLLIRLHERHSLRHAIGLGTTAAWATACDVYYGVYCLMLAAGYVIAISVHLHRVASPAIGKSYIRALDTLLVCLTGLVTALLFRQGWQFVFLGHIVRVRTVYTPLLLLTTLLTIRIGLYYRPFLPPGTRYRATFVLRVAAVAGLVAGALMSPLLLAVGEQVQSDRFERPKIFWRSSPPGIDLLAWVAPNPNHPLAPASIGEWLSHVTRDGYIENVASIPLVVLAVIAFALAHGWRPPAAPLAITIGFGLLALGPFVRIVGTDTHVPGPWALLRYLPIVGLARSPSRFSILVMLGVAAAMAGALHAIVLRRPAARLLTLSVITCLLFIELLPAPRTLHSAAIPTVYRTVAADPRQEVAVLELPFGLRDGTMSVGNFTARTQFYQTAHHKPILGGYLSRVSQRRVADTRRDPLLRALLRLSEGQAISKDEPEILRAQWKEFTRRNAVGYVVVDHERASPDLRSLITSTLQLPEIGMDGALHLYRP